MADDAYLTIAEAAELLRLDHKTIRRAIRSGKLAASRWGRIWRIRREAIDALEALDSPARSGEGQSRRRQEPRPRTDTVLPPQPSPLRLVTTRGLRPSTSGDNRSTGGAT